MADVSNRATHFFLNIPSYTVESLFYGSVAEDAVVEKKKEFESYGVSSKVYVAFFKKSKDTQAKLWSNGRSWQVLVVHCHSLC